MKIDLSKIKKIEAVEDVASRILKAALMYVDAGLYVVPIVPGGKALPPERHGINYGNASKSRKTIMSWFGPGGKFEGWNIGLACGKADGIFVVDLDEGIDKKTGKSKDGVKTWERLERENEYEYQGPAQRTASGGRHLIFKWSDNGSSSTGKIAKNIDTRGGDSESHKGHIVVWPSVVGDSRYTWEDEGEVSEAPQWVTSKLGVSWKKPTGGGIGPGRGNELVSDDDINRKYTIDEIARFLKYINPDDLEYDQWLSVGQGIHSQHPDYEGLNLWDDWSRRGQRYELGECAIRWDGFSTIGGVTIGTVIWHAREGGMPSGDDGAAAQDFSKDDNYEGLIAEMNKEFCIVPMGGDICVLQKRNVPEEMSHEAAYVIYRRGGFKNLLENQRVPMVDANGRTVMMSVADLWLADENRRTYPMGMGMFPGQPQDHAGYYNMWQGFAVEPCPGKWGLFKSHIRDIICGGNVEMFEWVMDWMADLVQHPAHPKGVALILQGIEGCGKGTFAAMLGKVFGSHYKHVTDEEHLVGRFNGHLMDAVLVFADEVTYGGSKKVAGKLKSMVTEKYVLMEKKGIDTIMVKNNVHLLVASNENWVIPAGPESRRWLCLAVLPDRAGDRAYFTALHEQMEQEGGFEAMLHELQHRKVTNNLTRAPVTKLLIAQRAQYSSMDSAVDWWSTQLDRHKTDFVGLGDSDNDWPEMALRSNVFDSYASWCVNFRRKQVAKNRFYDTMVELGMEVIRPRVAGDDRPRAFRLPPVKQAMEILRDKYSIDLTINSEEST